MTLSRQSASIVMSVASLLAGGAQPALADNPAYVDPSTTFATDNGGSEFGGSSDCDTTCKQVINEANSICDSNGQTSMACVSAKESQIFYQCLSYDQAGWSALFDTYMIAMDTIAGASCTVACVSMMRADAVSGAIQERVCNGLATADAMGEFSDGVALNRLLGNFWMGTTTFSQVSTALNMAGILGGLMAL